MTCKSQAKLIFGLYHQQLSITLGFGDKGLYFTFPFKFEVYMKKITSWHDKMSVITQSVSLNNIVNNIQLHQRDKYSNSVSLVCSWGEQDRKLRCLLMPDLKIIHSLSLTGILTRPKVSLVVAKRPVSWWPQWIHMPRLLRLYWPSSYQSRSMSSWWHFGQ